MFKTSLIRRGSLHNFNKPSRSVVWAKKVRQPTRTLLQLPVIDYSKDDALISAEIECEVEKIGSPVRRMDTMIAAVAINKSISLLSLDPKHFAPIAKRFPLKLFQNES